MKPLLSVLSSDSLSAESVVLNDCHSGLNATPVQYMERPITLAGLRRVLRVAHQSNLPLSVSGGRHAMGGQQFARDGLSIDMRGLNRVRSLDLERGIVDVEAGITWPELVEYLNRAPRGRGGEFGWTIRQKQTGADELTLGGALAANVHGRGLTRRPIIDEIESFRLMKTDGEVVECSRTENRELFSLAVGGYGLFGIVCSVKLRLTPRRKVRRVVRIIESQDLPAMFDRRIREGFQYGDFQFAIDHESDDFLHRGVFSCYQPVADDTPMRMDGPRLTPEDWKQLIYLAHAEKSRAFQLYAGHYQRTDGEVFFSDEHQFTVYQDGYHRDIDARLGVKVCGGEMITEIYVPRDRLLDFLDAARKGLRERGGNVIYGTVRLIEPETDSFLNWATKDWACIVFNLCVRHTPEQIEQAKDAFRFLIDTGLEQGGSFYLTYHRWAAKAQLEQAYPQFEEFLERKREYDPRERFSSDWYRHHRQMFN